MHFDYVNSIYMVFDDNNKLIVNFHFCMCFFFAVGSLGSVSGRGVGGD